MTVMQFDSHRGWYNPNPSPTTRFYRCAAPAPRRQDPKTVPIESRDFFVLLDDARRGCAESRTELALRGQTTAPRVPLA